MGIGVRVGTGLVDRGIEEGERWNCGKAEGMGAGMWWASWYLHNQIHRRRRTRDKPSVLVTQSH
jgi:hypothetical protein